MEGTSILSVSSSSATYGFCSKNLPKLSDVFFYTPQNPHRSSSRNCRFVCFLPYSGSPKSSVRASTFVFEGKALEKPAAKAAKKGAFPKVDKSGRFCSPRAARELALIIVYAACLEGSDPVRLFEKRLNMRREPSYTFEKETLLEYNHMSFGGPPVTAETVEEADQLVRRDEEESAIEAEVLSAPPKLVYSKLILSFTRKLLVAVVDKWDSHVAVINKVVPPVWQAQPAGRILELSILHLAMSEISVLGTRHQIVINEAVDLAKRFCDGTAARVINGCLRTFVRESEDAGLAGVMTLNEKDPVNS